MDEECFSRFDTQGPQLGREGLAGDKWAGGRGCGHGSAVSLPGASQASGLLAFLIDQRSFPQVRLGMPK
ncbi:hypothetical protein JCM4814A_59050 [Streptomyces phaeofaciens JCM 4814]|uniref:Uncharacterized protein n=1 Tax=Streptomyces phaeofaciens TaxID=68254 RepID=A0A918HMY6_9ACTN|nr:hypothetical protein GCM10010226_65820 [Streptomyces phaeofaciens]